MPFHLVLLAIFTLSFFLFPCRRQLFTQDYESMIYYLLIELEKTNFGISGILQEH